MQLFRYNILLCIYCVLYHIYLQTYYFRVAFKPVATIMKEQNTIDKDGNQVKMKGKGRHDPCVVPRAVPIVEALAAMVLTDFMILDHKL